MSSTEPTAPSLELVINNAGISASQNFGQWTSNVMAESFQTNTIGPALLAQELAPLMNEGARLVNLSSGLASLELSREPAPGLDAYAMSKAALNMLTRRLAEQLRPAGVTVIALSPGWVRTDMGGKEAPLSVEESINGMTAVIENLTLARTGTFIDVNGEELPW